MPPNDLADSRSRAAATAPRHRSFSPVSSTQQARQQLRVLEGVAVPQKLIASFQQAFAADRSIVRPPFSYSRPLPPSAFPAGVKPTVTVKLPRVGTIVPPSLIGAEKRKRHHSERLEAKKKLWEEIDNPDPSEKEAPKMQHLQYNSPMQLYSRESAEEQYRQQAASVPNLPPTEAPSVLGGGNRRFDPTKSEALKAIQEQDKQDQFGKNFFEKVAQAEAPNVPHSREPQWANEARQKQERARSQTPGAYQNYHQFDNYGIPAGPPPTFTSGPELETNRLSINEWQQQRHRRSPSAGTHHNPSGLASEKGYLFGGMDFIDHTYDPYKYDNTPSYDTYPKRREPKDHSRPGYNYGLDFTKNAYIDGSDRDYYHGYGPQQPKLKSKYSADPHAPINTYVSPNVEAVNPVRLIGDTLSNQKVPHEKYLTEEEKRTFATSFAPPPGFKRDHVTVRVPPKPHEPICYSLSAKKRPQSTQPTAANQYQVKPRSKTPDASNNDRWYTGGNKEVLTSEPNWARTVDSRRNAWERQAQNVDARVQLPASAKVPPPQQPQWANRSVNAHNAWQITSDRHGSTNQSNYNNAPAWNTYNSGANYVSNANSGYNTQQQQRNQYTENVTRTTTTNNTQQQQAQAIPLPYSGNSYSSTNNYSSSTANQYQPAPFGSAKTTYSYQQSAPQVRQTGGQILTESSSTSKTENRSSLKSPAPVPPPRTPSAHYQEQRTKNYEKTTEERVIPLPAPQQPPQESKILQQNDYNRYYKKQTTEQHGYTPDGRPLPPTKTVTSQQPEDFNRHSEMSETLPLGSLSNTKSNAQGNFTDQQGHNIHYTRELTTSADPGREYQLLKEEERRVVDEPLENGVISRHVTTKFYKKKTITDTSTVNAE
uniref:ZM domain-containing protein n=1 Tax=Panagrellus redivivus TaxID=6233 RepID=A0A7E4VA61_PANRE